MTSYGARAIQGQGAFLRVIAGVSVVGDVHSIKGTFLGGISTV